jgi:hypothetical protein
MTKSRLRAFRDGMVAEGVSLVVVPARTRGRSASPGYSAQKRAIKIGIVCQRSS